MSIEYAILFLAVLFGAYVWTGRALSARGAWRNPARLPLWHAVFSALAGFAAAFIGLKWLENNSPASALPGTLSARELSVSLAAALVSGAVGFWKARRLRRESPSHLGNFLEDDAEWAETIFSAGLMASVLMIFFLQAFKIPSSSMEKTLLIGDHLFVNKFLYGLRVPVSGRRIMPLRPVSRGDIAVFQFPDPNPKAIHCGAVQAGRAFIKRVIGLPGDTIEVREGRVYVNGALLAPEPYAVYSAPMRFPKPDAPPRAGSLSEAVGGPHPRSKAGKLRARLLRPREGPSRLLFPHGRQPRSLLRLALLGARPAQGHRGQGMVHLLAAGTSGPRPLT